MAEEAAPQSFSEGFSASDHMVTSSSEGAEEAAGASPPREASEPAFLTDTALPSLWSPPVLHTPPPPSTWSLPSSSPPLFATPPPAYTPPPPQFGFSLFVTPPEVVIGADALTKLNLSGSGHALAQWTWEPPPAEAAVTTPHSVGAAREAAAAALQPRSPQGLPTLRVPPPLPTAGAARAAASAAMQPRSGSYDRASEAQAGLARRMAPLPRAGRFWSASGERGEDRWM